MNDACGIFLTGLFFCSYPHKTPLKSPYIEGGFNMNIKQIQEITKLQIKGYGYKRIANILNLSANTVKSYSRRHPLNTKKIAEMSVCLNCGKDFTHDKQRASKKFCSNKCRLDWWKSNTNIQGDTKYICKYCGRTFFGYKSKHRKYCCRVCYSNSKRRDHNNE